MTDYKVIHKRLPSYYISICDNLQKQRKQVSYYWADVTCKKCLKARKK